MSKEIKGLTFQKGYKSKNGDKPGKVFSTPLGYTYKINDIQDVNYNKFTGEKYLSNTYNVTQFVDNKVKGDTIAKDIDKLNLTKSLYNKTLKQYIIAKYLMDRNLLEDDTTRRLLASIPEPVRNNIDKFLEITVQEAVENTWQSQEDKGTE